MINTTPGIHSQPMFQPFIPYSMHGKSSANCCLRRKERGANYFFSSSFFIDIPFFFGISIEAGIMDMCSDIASI